MLLKIPLEILYLILDELQYPELWVLYNTSKIFRSYVAQKLVRTPTIEVESIFPRRINQREMAPADILDILRTSLPHIRSMKLCCQECLAQPDWFNLLAQMPNLSECRIFGSKSKRSSDHGEFDRRFVQSSLLDTQFRAPPVTEHGAFSSLKYLKLGNLWTGVVVLPELPSLLRLSVAFHPDRNGYDGPDTSCVVIVDFAKLPQLQRLKITRKDEGVFITSGTPRCVECLEMYDSFVDWGFLPLLASLGTNLKKVRMAGCSISYHVQTGPSLKRLFDLPRLQKLELKDSINFLPMLLPEQSITLEEVVIKLGDKDLNEDWDHLKELLSLLPKEWKSIKLTDPDNTELTYQELEDWDTFETYYREYFIIQ